MESPTLSQHPQLPYGTDSIRTYAGDHFFDEGWMRQFRTRLGSDAYEFPGEPDMCLFVTSDAHPTKGRVYSIRASKYAPREGWKTHTYGEAGAFRRSASAKAHIAKVQRELREKLADQEDALLTQIK